ncbi:MobF family relaxase [Marinobacter sp. M-5]|uniref:MobF family relaxase n=1 Tax=Marinobacter sp. M-5 TaxID=3081089 RepID=UPI00293CC9F1|nr:MobF family relaxase [Marinobacter sp. M-5]MDV3502527.1 MobF family relaxase [Marinobacter sp. M-5]
MLSMNSINNLDYYANLASEDYYISGGEPAGRWAGLGARLSGLQGEVDTKDYRSIFRGCAPDGTALCENPGDHHRAGWDLTFSAPKSLSILWARSDADLRQLIQAGQLKAVKQALSFLEQHAGVTRRGHAGHEQEAVTGLVAALFEHSTSRAQDPQLHTHCLVANAAPRTDGTWGTLESRQLFLWQKAAGAVYRSALANHLREIGFGVEKREGKAHFEVQGIPQQICEHFSKRAEAIEAALDGGNVSSSASTIGDAIKLITRIHKQQVDRPALFRQWHQELDTLGLSARQAEALRVGHPMFESNPLPLTSIVEKVVEKQAVFRLQDLYFAIALEAQWNHADLRDIECTVKHLVEQQEVIALGRDEANNQLFSTPEMIGKEQELIRLADQLQQKAQYQLSEQIIQDAIQKQARRQGFALSDEQAEGVFSVCQSGLDILQGAAGAGKSTSMQAVKIAYEAAGFKVIGATVARQAANQLEAETGIKSYTLAKILNELEHDRLQLDNTALLVDEAGQLSSLDLLRLVDAVRQASGKLILVGEQQQMDAISHGGSLSFLSRRQGCARIEIVRRQDELWARETVKQLRAGDAKSALHAYQARGLLSFGDNSADAREQLMQSWQKFQETHPDKQAMILAQRWRDVQPLNESVRRYYQEHGLVGRENIETDCRVSKQVMRFQFSTGERVRFTRNDYPRGFTNGDLGTIERVEKNSADLNFTVRCDNGRTVSFKQSDYCDDQGPLCLAQAYATTVYASQGSTVKGDVFVYYTSGMDRAASYVAGSRHKGNCHWFFNREEIDALSGNRDRGQISNDSERLDVLAKNMSRNKRPSLAIEFLESSDLLEISKAEVTKEFELELDL